MRFCPSIDKFLKKFVFIISQENINAIKVENDMDSLKKTPLVEKLKKCMYHQHFV